MVKEKRKDGVSERLIEFDSCKSEVSTLGVAHYKYADHDKFDGRMV